ncbi:MAG: peptidylprolyl isomerase [Brachymonas sp.]|jgi:peptidyl-prolyl cis-trans isomerase C|nr:peptidylprolyl isomerase [Brachymonas sp.]
MKPVLTPALRALSLSTLLALCGPSVAVAQNVAVVNGKPIPKARLNAMMAQFAAEAARNNQPLPPNLEAQVRTHLIKEAIIVQQAERQKLHLTSEYAEKMASARGALLASMLFEQYKKDHPISDAAAKAEYDRILASIPAEQSNAIEYNARHILVKTADEARAVQAELTAGKAFDALARKHSQDKGSAQQGGELGWAPADTYVPQFAAALKKLKKGQTTAAPVRTQFGYHIIRLDDTRKSQPPSFESIKDQIKLQMQNGQAAEFENYLNNLEKSARIQ